jgi:hypothetical protein
MHSLRRLGVGCGLIAFGFVLGSCNHFGPVEAQEAANAPTDDTIKKIIELNGKMKATVESLRLESRYESATKEINTFAVMVGGLNVKEDLESGHGVDPETFAALYVAAYDIKKLNITDESLADWVDKSQLGYDADGRVTYGNKVVRIYPVAKLKKLRAERLALLSEGKLGTKP